MYLNEFGTGPSAFGILYLHAAKLPIERGEPRPAQTPRPDPGAKPILCGSERQGQVSKGDRHCLGARGMGAGTAADGGASPLGSRRRVEDRAVRLHQLGVIGLQEGAARRIHDDELALVEGIGTVHEYQAVRGPELDMELPPIRL